jgi:aryl-alcohol dehydrogenase-like predicted oxidoreductase
MNTPLNTIPLGKSPLQVTPICLGTMTFGEQVAEPDAHACLSRAVERGVNFIDTAEMYAVPTRAETYGATETIIGNWFKANPGLRQKVVLASKVAGPSRGTPWIRHGRSDVTRQDIVDSCNASLKRLQTDVIDLYQIHWPIRHVPAFGVIYFDPKRAAEQEAALPSVLEQLQVLQGLQKEGKIREIGLSNETSWGVHEFVRLSEQHGLPRPASVQNAYCLTNRIPDNGLDESLHRLQVGLLAYSPLGFGLLTGKYDESGFTGPGAPADARLAKFESAQKQRWGRPDGLAAARLYNALARRHGLTPAQLALRFCYHSWRVASTIIGVTSVAQLDECLDAWGTPLSADVLAEIDAIRWKHRDPSQ